LLLLITELQLVQGALLTPTLKPLAVVAPHELLLLEKKLSLQEYAPKYKTLIDPPYKFADKESTSLLVKDLQLEQGTLLTTTLTPLAMVAPHELLLLEDAL
jgi:hypothetical protein